MLVGTGDLQLVWHITEDTVKSGRFGAKTITLALCIFSDQI